ncbi:hypothetical protein PF010_g18020 [Phytophthora fragariae]|uniref:Uncharacterized protein n=1 Tax=Phytophthora fragariae TaxID=53985 RepID=A0A6G0KLE1_9STRA|nr:hypothetical protein PF010_g18020 [Phytophthora fragariae]
MRNHKGVVSLTETVYRIFNDTIPSKAAARASERPQVRAPQPVKPAEPRGGTHQGRRLNLDPLREEPSPEVQQQARAQSGDDGYAVQKPTLKTEEWEHGYVAVLKGTLSKQWKQFSEVEQKLQADHCDEIMRVNEDILYYVESKPPTTRSSVHHIEEFLTRQGEHVLEKLDLLSKQKKDFQQWWKYE